MLSSVEQELPLMSDIAKADNIEQQEITENTVRSTKDLIVQLDNQTKPPGNLFEHPLDECLGLDKEH